MLASATQAFNLGTKLLNPTQQNGLELSQAKSIYRESYVAWTYFLTDLLGRKSSLLA